MSLKLALLGFLNYGSMTGYEIKKFFDTSVVHFWSAELSQIYPILKQMQSEGLVDMHVEVQHDRPNRKVYSITDEGRGELLEWLAQPAEPVQIREPLFLKLFFGANLPKKSLVRVLRHDKDRLRRDIASLQSLRSLIRAVTKGIGLRRDSFHWELTLEAGVHISEAGIEWINQAIDRIEQLDDSDPGRPRTPAGHEEVRTAIEILDRFKASSDAVGSHIGLEKDTRLPRDGHRSRRNG